MITRRGWLNTPAGPEKRVATYSPCENFRYELRIEFPINMMWTRGREIAFVGMNPSTATEMVDDPTLRRVKRFSQDWGFGTVTMLNAYALRSTDPKGLRLVKDPRGGPACDATIIRVCQQVERIVLAWGSNTNVLEDRRRELFALLWPFREKVVAFGVNADGSPVHPLYQKADRIPERYEFMTEARPVQSPPAEVGDVVSHSVRSGAGVFPGDEVREGRPGDGGVPGGGGA